MNTTNTLGFDPLGQLGRRGDHFVAPNPGGASTTQGAGAVGANAAAAPPPGQRIHSGSNPLVALANPLLNLIPQIRTTVHHADPAMLREQLVAELRQFETRAREAGIANETIIGARYCLCTTLDEAATLTPWGGAGVWSASSLLVTFHNETWGGEKFFQLLSRLASYPAQHVDLLELQYFCLMLGFEGRYRVLDQGRSQLDVLKQRLLQLIRTQRGEHASALSPHWHDPVVAARAQRSVPLWAVASVAALACVGLFIGLQWSLSSRSDEVYAAIDQLRVPRVVASAARPVPAPQARRLAQFLETEIAEKLVSVLDLSDRSTVIIRGDSLFESGAGTVSGSPAHAALLERIGKALNAVPGAVLVVGYTDDVPTRGLRFASNWELSVARAESVKNMLQALLDQKNRLRAEGRGAAEPAVPNDSPANRARNRRVEITLMVPPAAPATESAP
ncbi:DotU family type VI secretion system protein [Massilia rubra]|uniref:DotU family type VI secretion system protein n=1 Tax=Massilia rubra TaxID=2607910 RepID=A0ABX0M371_9BURK|nr:DotU family type VI secretion system protein [Massilia rubra]NHZ36681.1 DotU family type VI secretion system protein [Massilia rubra]